MCQSKAQGGARCGQGAIERLDNIYHSRDLILKERSQLRRIPENNLTPEHRDRLSKIDAILADKEEDIKEMKLQFAGSGEGQKRLKEEIAKAEAENDLKKADSLRNYAEKAAQYRADMIRSNLEKYGPEAVDKKLRGEYLPQVYRFYGTDSLNPVPESPPLESDRETRQRLKEEGYSPRQAAARLLEIKEARTFYSQWSDSWREVTKRKPGSPIPSREVTQAYNAYKLSSLDHGENSRQAKIAKYHAEIIKNAHAYESEQQKNSDRAKLDEKQKVRWRKEGKRQEEALAIGKILDDARFKTDLDRQLSPHGVNMDDLGQARHSYSDSTWRYGADSQKAKVDTAIYKGVKKAWETRERMLNEVPAHDRRSDSTFGESDHNVPLRVRKN